MALVFYICLGVTIAIFVVCLILFCVTQNHRYYLYAVNCTFENNSATNWGGAIYLYFAYDEDTNPIINSTFINNVAKKGGAIYVGDESSLTTFNCTFIKNKASEDGGAIYFEWCGNDNVIEFCSFINNTAGEDR